MRRVHLLRRVSSVLMLFLVLAVLSLPFSRFSANAEPKTLIVPDDTPTIQSAVDIADPGDTIFVRNGTYLENVLINKAVTISGENKTSTIVDGVGSGSAFTISASSVIVANFTIQNSAVGFPNSGIRMLNASWCTVRDNVLSNDFVGILLEASYGNVVERNSVAGAQYGIYLLNSPGNRIIDNILSANYAGFVLYSTASCQIAGNTVNNNTVGISMTGSIGNSIYYNNFMTNSYQTSLYGDILSNTWDNGYPFGGNYWSDYRGPDIYKGPFQNITGSDGIGDLAYQIKVNNTDRFPFMDPVTIFHDIAIFNVLPSTSKIYQGQTVSISVVAANLGNYTETFPLSIYYVKDSVETLISTGSVTDLATHTNKTVTFTWDTTGVTLGNCTIKAQTGTVEGDKNLTSNIAYSAVITVTERFHDVAVLTVTASAPKVYQGQTLNISVTVGNVGNYTESFTVKAYYDDSVIGQQSVSALEIGSQATLVYSWNTTDVESGKEYPLKAEASGVSGEVNLSNNVLVDGSIKVRSFELDAIKIAQVTPSDHLGNPVSNFNKGAISYFKVTVNNTSGESEIVLVTVNVFDSFSSSMGVVSFKGLIMPGISVFILGLPISNTAHTGIATVYANTFTDWPFAGGLPYSPEKSATFQIQS
jgi:nitrous oxidase accessory protein